MKPAPPHVPKPPSESWWCRRTRAEFSEQLRLNQPRITESKFGQAIFVSATAQKDGAYKR